MSEINDGGPAFPIPSVGTGDPRDGMTSGSEGMSLRDYFAGQALAGVMQDWINYRKSDGGYIDDETHELIAEDAYGIADAMLKARGQ